MHFSDATFHTKTKVMDFDRRNPCWKQKLLNAVRKEILVSPQILVGGIHVDFVCLRHLKFERL
uniref:Uncharacterized protein n=1 Tax=Rhizophora mucronata TaxID=61149 RepID=A0A2P2LQR7_RHIMU